jgi:hypothetical protein
VVDTIVFAALKLPKTVVIKCYIYQLLESSRTTDTCITTQFSNHKYNPRKSTPIMIL